ncbi:hypothetical protein ACHAWU_008958 [Discostella pseudostelligera]|uniref:Calmodulin n=1 Tax=Discostella pseudostelligera TaxID=259834 RepID=A0ABD3MGM2_9STRA
MAITPRQKWIITFFSSVAGMRTNVTVTAFQQPRVDAQRRYNFRPVHQPIYTAVINGGICEHEGCAIMEGTSPKALKLRKQIQAVWNDSMNTCPIILHGPRGSGKGELADEIVYHLPQWQTRNVHRLSLDDGLNFIDTILGTVSHPGLLDDLAGQTNTTLILKGFQSLHVESKGQYERRKELVLALNSLVTSREYFSTFENKTKSFLPRIIGCTQRDPDYFTNGLDGKSNAIIFIKVPSFESRAADLKYIAKQKLKCIEGNFGLENVQLSKEATQRLLDHRWEVDGDAELDSELYKGLERLASEMKWNPFASNMLKSQHLLVYAYDERTRIRLLHNVPFLRQIIMSPWVFDHTLRYIVTPVFIVLLLVLFLGPQSRAACILAFPGTLSYMADAASVPFESLVNIWKRKLTPRPSENGAIVNLYESLMKENVGMSTIMSEWDLDSDGIVSSWEMEEGFKALRIPKYHHDLLRRILLQDRDNGLSVSTLMDKIQELYTDITEAELLSPHSLQNIKAEITLQTKLTFVEMFNRLDSNGNGYISKDEFATMSDLGYFKRPLTKLELSDMFDKADMFQLGRLNLFEFMSIMRKTVRVEIQEIGYGYLPLAWGSLTAYWSGLGMQELGLSLVRKFRFISLPFRSTAVEDELCTISDEDICEHEGCAIMEGTSPKVIKLRKQIQEIVNDPMNTCPIILHGPRGSGKGELADEIVYHLPQWQTRNVHRLSLDDGLHFIDTILGTVSHPGLLDDLAGQTNTSLILKGFQSLHVESKAQYDRRKELLHALNSIVVRREYFSTFENKTKSFLPRVIRCTQRDPDYFTNGLDGKSIDAIFIKVPSFESRAADLKYIALRKIKQIERNLGLENVQLSKEATQCLLDHRWEVDGDAELDSELYKGLERLASEMKCDPYAANMVMPKHLLVDAYDERIRNRLLYNIPILRQIVISPWIFYHTIRYIVTPLFIVALIVMFLGPQTRDQNTALTIFWAGWWPGAMLMLPLFGPACILAFPGTLSYMADAASVPFESLVNIWKRKLTPRPSENGAIINLYESLMKENVGMSTIMSEWDLDSDGIVSSWEMEEGFKALHIPKRNFELLLNVLMQDRDNGLSVSTLMDKIQELYTDITEAELLSKPSYKHFKAANTLETKLTFVDLFNRLDSNGNGYISKDEFATMSDLGYFKRPLTKLELSDMFDKADMFQLGRLNLFEFMSIMRKTVRVEIQEIGYGYLPLAWGSLTAYWSGLGMQELGLSLVRLSDTFHLPITTAMKSSIPQFAASSSAVHAAQSLIMMTSLIGAISLTQKLCDDNKVGIVRYLAHATVQVVGAFDILYLMLSPDADTIATAY